MCGRTVMWVVCENSDVRGMGDNSDVCAVGYNSDVCENSDVGGVGDNSGFVSHSDRVPLSPPLRK